MIAIDTTVVVAAFAVWHEFHSTARDVLARRPALPFQAALEAYSVLTRLPPPHRSPASVVHQFIAAHFGTAMLFLPIESHAAFLGELARLGIAGGATYDALIAATAREATRVLVTFDLRARLTYERMGVEVEFLGATA